MGIGHIFILSFNGINHMPIKINMEAKTIGTNIGLIVIILENN